MYKSTDLSVRDSAVSLTFLPSFHASSYIGGKMNEREGERIVVTTVNRDVAFIYIKF
jgi:hypothetical protein